MKHLPGITFASRDRVPLLILDGLPIGIDLRYTGFPEILLGQNVHGQLGPLIRDLNVIELEYNGAIRIPDFRRPGGKWNAFVGRFFGSGKTAFDFHDNAPWARPQSGPEVEFMWFPGFGSRHHTSLLPMVADLIHWVIS